jgi:hypothetical protein
MKSPPPTKHHHHHHLSSTAILVLAANTMNGPGITTLPDVAANAGRTLYILLIGLSAGMAAFVCRRMVYAMWHNTSTITTTTTPTTIATREGSVELLDVNDKHDADTSFGYSTSSSTETSQLLESAAGNEKSITVHHPRPILEFSSIVGQSREAFDQQTGNVDDHDDHGTGEKRGTKRRTLPPSTRVAFLMVASALCLGLAQMVRERLMVNEKSSRAIIVTDDSVCHVLVHSHYTLFLIYACGKTFRCFAPPYWMECS